MTLVRESVPGSSEPGDDPTIDADDLCYIAGKTVTRMYRTSHPSAAEVDAAHGRVWNRTKGVGVVTTDDDDVALILAATAAIR